MPRSVPQTDDNLEDAPEAFRRHKLLEKRLAGLTPDELDDPPVLVGAVDSTTQEPTEEPERKPPEPKVVPAKPLSPQEMLSRHLETRPAQQVILRTQEAVMRIAVLDIALNEAGIAFFVPHNCSVEFNFGVQLKVEIAKKLHDVVYAGGFFSFPEMGFNILSFLRKPSNQDTSQ